MTEPTQPETGKEPASQELPIPKLENASSGGPTSSVDIDAIAKQVAERIQNDLRMAQSTKDKEIAKIKKQLGIGDLSELEEMGAQIPDNVKLEYRLRQIETARTPESSPSQPTSSPGNGAALSAQDVSEVVKNFNLDANSADVIEALRGTYRNRDHFEATLARMAMAKANKPTGSAAESPALESAPASSSKTDVNVLINRLSALQKEPTKNKEEIRKLKKELDDRDWK